MNDDNIEKLRTLSFQYKLEGDYKKAVDCRNQIIELERAELGDYYFIGEWYIDSKQYQLAEEILTQCIELGKEQKDSYYESASYLLRAYAYIKLNNYKKAYLDINYLENNFEDSSITWLTNHPAITIPFLKDLLLQFDGIEPQ